MVLSVLLKFLYPASPNLAIEVLAVAGFLSLSSGGWNEIKGKHMQYSKLRDKNNLSQQLLQKNDKDEEAKKMKMKMIKRKAEVPSQVGMLVLYTPAFLAGLSSFFIVPYGGDFRFNVLRSAVALHFFKRVLEVMFVHKFTGSMDVEAMITISLSYLLFASTAIYNQYLMQAFPEPDFDLKYIGIALFLVGIFGNFYHHLILSNLRKDGEKQYKIPQGGLFSLVICPHYLFEIVEFLGISCISQSRYTLAFTMGTVFYLMGRSYATRKWYESKFDDFPEDVKALFPYVF